jgi:hypothetical protein
VLNSLARQEMLKDPHEKDGGSRAVVERERQAIHDLEMRTVAIRRAISRANSENSIKVGNMELPISDWLCWRRDVAPGQRQFLDAMSKYISATRDRATKQGFAINPAEPKPQDVVVNLDELALAEELEQLETTLGTLDGQLSLKNATITIDIS